jgi:hypothetical protein
MVPEQQRVEALRQILLQLYALVDLGMPWAKVRRVAREAIFFLYEGGEALKYHEDRPHSAAARALRKHGKRLYSSHGIRYEHAIPIATLEAELRSATATSEGLCEFLRKFLRTVVITSEEDKKLTAARLARRMPEGAHRYDMLARYRFVGIEFLSEDEAKLRQ